MPPPPQLAQQEEGEERGDVVEGELVAVARLFETARHTAPTYDGLPLHLQQQMYTMVTELYALERQKSAFMLRTMATPLALLYASTYALCLKVRPFGGGSGSGETVVHQLMIGAGVITLLLLLPVIPLAYYTQFDLTRPFGQPFSRVLLLLLGLIAAIMMGVAAVLSSVDLVFFIFSLLIIVLLLLIFAFIVQWTFHNFNRQLEMPEEYATHGALLLSLEIFCIFLYVLLALRIYCFVLSGGGGGGGGGGGDIWNWIKDF